MGVAEEDNEVIYIEGVNKGVNVCVDLEDAAGYFGVEYDFTFVLVDGGDVEGPNVKVMQGCWGWQFLHIGTNCSFSLIPGNCLLWNLLSLVHWLDVVGEVA